MTSLSFARFGGVEITRIGPADWERFRSVRLASLSESPAAFGSRYADWVDAPAERWQSRLTHVPLTLLAQEGTQVVGVVSGQPVGETWVELISMWVAPAARGTGVAGQLIGAVVDWAAGDSVNDASRTARNLSQSAGPIRVMSTPVKLANERMVKVPDAGSFAPSPSAADQCAVPIAHGSDDDNRGYRGSEP